MTQEGTKRVPGWLDKGNGCRVSGKAFNKNHLLCSCA